MTKATDLIGSLVFFLCITCDKILKLDTTNILSTTIHNKIEQLATVCCDKSYLNIFPQNSSCIFTQGKQAPYSLSLAHLEDQKSLLILFFGALVKWTRLEHNTTV